VNPAARAADEARGAAPGRIARAASCPATTSPPCAATSIRAPERSAGGSATG